MTPINVKPNCNKFTFAKTDSFPVTFSGKYIGKYSYSFNNSKLYRFVSHFVKIYISSSANCF